MNIGRRDDPPVTFEGRLLARPEVELTDQGLNFDVATLLNRRQALRALGLGAIGLGLAACSTTPSSAGNSVPGVSAEIPDETAGPYPGDGSNGPDVLEQSGVVRSDIRSSFGEASGTAVGVPMTVQLTIKDLARGGAAFAGVAVYVWHCNRDGKYSLYSDGITHENYLRGVQVADAAGKVTFSSIFPACYSGRWPHVHFEVYPHLASITDESKVLATSQVALPVDVAREVYATTGYEASITNLARVSLADDNVFGDDDGVSQLGTVTGDVGKGYTVSLTAGVDTTTTPTGGQNSGDGAPSGGPGGAPPSGGPGQPPSGPPPSGAATPAPRPAPGSSRAGDLGPLAGSRRSGRPTQREAPVSAAGS